MRKYLYISMLLVALGGHFIASADLVGQKRANVVKNSPKVNVQKPIPSKQPGKLNKSLEKKHSHHSSSSSDSNRCSSCEYVISSSDINKGKGVLIDKPGVWCLDGDAVFNPKFSRYSPPDPRAVQAAITVKAGVSNVTINLADFTLSQAGSGTSTQTPFVIGILVPDPDPTNLDPNFVGAESIYIQGDNAIIDGFSMYGVRVFAHTSDIQLDNLTIKNCGVLASKALRPMVYGQPYLPHDQGAGSAFGPSFGVAGLSIGESVGLGEGATFFTDVSTKQLNVVNRTQNVRLNNVNCINNFSYGAWIKLTTNLYIDNCHFDYNWSDEPGSNIVPAFGASPAYGMVFHDSQAWNIAPNGNTDPCNLNVSVSNSTFNHNSLRGDYTTPLASLSTSQAVYGCISARSKNSIFYNCQFNDSSCTFPNAVGTTSRAGGFLDGGGSEDGNFINCNFDGSLNLGRVLGYNLSGTTSNEPIKSARNLTFINCTANNLQCRTDLILPAPVLSTSTIQGYSFSSPKDVYMENCQSNDLYVFGPCPSTGSTNAGFAPASTSGAPSSQMANCVFKNCISERVRSIDGGTSWGFNTFVSSPNTGLSILYEDCVSTGHQATVASIFPAWSSATTYSVASEVSFSGVNYVSLINTNLNHAPNVSPTQWSVVNTAPPAWSSGTTYALGALVSFTDSTGHTNEYISTVAGNLGNYPNAAGPGVAATTLNWVQTNVYPTWNNAATYQIGSVVAFNGVNYRSLVASNMGFQPNVSPTQWSNNTTVIQLVAGGFFSQQNQVAGVGGPEIYQGCTATQNIGAPGPVSQAGIGRYSAGFSTTTSLGNIYNACKTAQNVYGLLLINSNSCVVSNCEAHNNGVSGVGDGFTDVGTGTAAAPTQSKSMFEANSAYNNGTGTLHVGPNGNYNIWVDAGTSIRPMLLTCTNSTANCTLTAPSTVYFGGKHNISTIK